MLINWPRLMNSRISRRRLRGCATLSSPSCTKMLVARPVVCQVECLTWEAWVVVCQVPEELVLAPVELGLPLRKGGAEC